MKTYECIIVWAWPAGIGVALKLQELWVEYIILEWESVGSSFMKWNENTRFISPSFPGNAFGQVDLNSIYHITSPGLMFRTEHPNGKQYAEYLRAITKKYNVPVKENRKVSKIEKNEDIFIIHTETETYYAKHIISATGEFNFPGYGEIEWSEYAIHSSKITDYSEFNNSQDITPIIGWYESCIDAAYSLYKIWKSAHIFCSHKMDEITTSDPSQVLSLHSLERLREIREYGDIHFTKDRITEIRKIDWRYILIWENKSENSFSQKAILATGFRSWLWYISQHVSYRPDRMPKLNIHDELEKTKNMFVVGPQVRQEELIFCFIYKFRLRFWIVALEIAKRLWKQIDERQIKSEWGKQWFYLSELEKCGDECVC
jgi:putative flavoprotein involved in K+ transport